MSEGSEKPAHGGWHMDKRINVGHILTTAALVVSALWWGSKVESRISVVEKTVELQSSTTQRELSEIKDALRRIEDKLERKADRR